MTPLISIIIPAYNAEKYLAQTLQSVLDQSFGSWECLVIDDGSKDGTNDVARSFAARDERIRAVQQANAGVANARNNALKQSTTSAPFVVFLDSDDVWLPDALQVLFDALEGSPDAVGAHGLADLINSEGEPIQTGEFAAFGRNRTTLKGRRFVPLGEDKPTTFEVVITQGRIFPPGLALLRKAAVESAGGFDPDLPPQEDWDLWIRLTRRGDFVFVPRVVIWYRRHEESASHDAGKSFRKAALVRHKMVYSPENTPAQANAARRAYKALQAWRIREKKDSMLYHWRRGELRRVIMACGRIPGNAGRFLRGFPTLRG
jgi:glycosyltransferase involved in cell wall biosynthesis